MRHDYVITDETHIFTEDFLAPFAAPFEPAVGVVWMTSSTSPEIRALIASKGGS